MKALALIFFAVSAFAQDIAAPAVQSACGPSQAQFVVKIGGDTLQSPPAQSDPAKASVYVIEEQKFKAVRDVTARVGLDGEWVGANRGNSYLFFTVDPGEHHLCTDWISDFLPEHRLVSLNLFTAEAGKTYYFRARTSGSPAGRTLDGATIDLDLTNSDEGKMLVAYSRPSVSHPKK